LYRVLEAVYPSDVPQLRNEKRANPVILSDSEDTSLPVTQQ